MHRAIDSELMLSFYGLYLIIRNHCGTLESPAMSTGKALNENEKRCIILLRSQGLSIIKIANALDRSETVVRNFLRNPEAYGTKKSKGRPPKLSAADRRKIVRLAATGDYNSRDILNEMKLDVTLRCVQRVLQAAPNLIYRKGKGGRLRKGKGGRLRKRK